MRQPIEAKRQRIVIKDVGFMTPESVLHDAEQDIYLVANINGDPLGVDGNGFISKLSPAGKLLALKFIDGATEGTTLNAPKGMAVFGDTLYVADITHVRMFERKSGKPKGAVAIAGATFVNDLVAAPDGTIYASDSGKTTGFKPSGSDAIWQIAPSKEAKPPVAKVLIKDKALGHPNGLAMVGDEIVVVTMGSGEILRLTRAGKRTGQTKAPKAALDGVEPIADDTLLVSSWVAKAIYKVIGDKFEVIASDLPSPADIGFDRNRRQVLVPLFNDNQVLLLPL